MLRSSRGRLTAQPTRSPLDTRMICVDATDLMAPAGKANPADESDISIPMTATFMLLNPFVV